MNQDIDSLHTDNVSDVLNKTTLNDRPIIGILSQELGSSLEEVYGDNYTSYIGAAYIKYIESAGARAVPILINQTDEYYEMIFNSVNGLLIPGGSVSLDTSGTQDGIVVAQFWRHPLWLPLIVVFLIDVLIFRYTFRICTCWKKAFQVGGRII